MPPKVVNLDALIRREDFATESKAPQAERVERVPIRDLSEGFFFNALRKPDFQRETAHWSPAKNIELIRAFLDGDLIPAVILWQSGEFVFVIDGAHRLSALIAWVQNDYGDGKRSLEFFENRIPVEQQKLADRTRALIKKQIGTYSEYESASKNPDNVEEKIRERARRLATRSFYIQWVPTADAKAAEDSFFKINEAGTPIDPTERRILKSRLSAHALAARAIVRGGTGHKYWRSFDRAVKEDIEKIGKAIYAALYEPPLKEPIKTLDIPVAGYGYSALPFIFDLVTSLNDIKIADSTKKTKTDDVLPEDEDGQTTLKYLKSVQDIVCRITGVGNSSIGYHPAVYFYTTGGSFQPSSFFAVVEMTRFMVSAPERMRDFTKNRREFEDFLVEYKDFTSQIVHRFGSGTRSIKWLLVYYQNIIRYLSEGKEILPSLLEDEFFKFLTADTTYFDDGNEHAERNFSRKIKSAAFIRDALKSATCCHICGARLHANSIQTDHIVRKQDKGKGNVENASPAHPYCNSTYKN